MFYFFSLFLSLVFFTFLRTCCSHTQACCSRLKSLSSFLLWKFSLSILYSYTMNLACNLWPVPLSLFQMRFKWIHLKTVMWSTNFHIEQLMLFSSDGSNFTPHIFFSSLIRSKYAQTVTQLSPVHIQHMRICLIFNFSGASCNATSHISMPPQPSSSQCLHLHVVVVMLKPLGFASLKYVLFCVPFGVQW